MSQSSYVLQALMHVILRRTKKSLNAYLLRSSRTKTSPWDGPIAPLDTWIMKKQKTITLLVRDTCIMNMKVFHD